MLWPAGSGVDAKPAPVRWRGGRQNWVLLASGLQGPGRAALHSFTAASGARLVSSWQPGVTHIICGLDDQKRAKCAALVPIAVLLCDVSL